MMEATDLPVVVVEDDPLTLNLFAAVLEERGFRKCALFDSSVQAAQFLRAHDAAVIILDLLLPEMPGMELLRHVSAAKPHIPVIVVTGVHHIDTAIDCMKLGAVDYLTKPFPVARLAAALERALALPRAVPPDTAPPPAGLEPFRVPDGVPERLAKAAAYMEEHLSGPLYLDAIAQEACLSKYHFCREFKKSFGATPIQFVLQRRIARACALLRGGAVSISEVAMQCGFSDQSEFTKWFRKSTGYTPSWYRKTR